MTLPKSKDHMTRNIIICLGITLGFLAFSIYNLMDMRKMTDESFDNGNATHVCIASAEVFSTENTGYYEIAKQTNIVDDAKKGWAKYNCQSVTLTDDHGNTCIGTTGFRFDGTNKDGSGIFTCADILKPRGNTIK